MFRWVFQHWICSHKYVNDTKLGRDKRRCDRCKVEYSLSEEEVEHQLSHEEAVRRYIRLHMRIDQ